MEILLNISDDLLLMSRGDVAAYKQATSNFVSSLRSDATVARELAAAATPASLANPETKSSNPVNIR
jgi:hypothetical protein